MKRNWPYYAQMMIGIANAVIQVIESQAARNVVVAIAACIAPDSRAACSDPAVLPQME